MAQENSDRPLLLAALNDLIFETKIRSTAERLGVAVRVVKRVSSLDALLNQGVSLLIVDLNSISDCANEIIAAASVCQKRPHVIAFVSHVDQDLAAAAIEAGADRVMPRSSFVVELPALLTTFCVDGPGD